MKHKVVAYLVAMMIAAVPALSYPSVVYTFESFSANGIDIAGSFTYTSPDFITDDRQIDASVLDACEVTAPADHICFDQLFYVDTAPLSDPPSDTEDAIGFGFANPNGFFYQRYGFVNHIFYYFENGALGAVGIYDTFTWNATPARLTVSLGSVPLPASLWLFGSGLIPLARVGRCTKI